MEGSSREHTRPRAPQKQPVGTPAGLPAQYDDSIVDDATPGRRHVCAPMVWNSELGETTPFRVWDLGFSIEVFYGTRSGVRRNPLRTHSLSLVYRFCGMAELMCRCAGRSFSPARAQARRAAHLHAHDCGVKVPAAQNARAASGSHRTASRRVSPSHTRTCHIRSRGGLRLADALSAPGRAAAIGWRLGAPCLSSGSRARVRPHALHRLSSPSWISRPLIVQFAADDPDTLLAAARLVPPLYYISISSKSMSI